MIDCAEDTHQHWGTTAPPRPQGAPARQPLVALRPARPRPARRPSRARRADRARRAGPQSVATLADEDMLSLRHAPPTRRGDQDKTTGRWVEDPHIDPTQEEASQHERALETVQLLKRQAQSPLGALWGKIVVRVMAARCAAPPSAPPPQPPGLPAAGATCARGGGSPSNRQSFDDWKHECSRCLALLAHLPRGGGRGGAGRAQGVPLSQDVLHPGNAGRGGAPGACSHAWE